MNSIDHSHPLQKPTLYILLSLRGGEKHGYAILKDVRELSDGQVQLSTGTLYGALYRLLDQGLVEQVDVQTGGRGKKGYRLTHAGLEVFEAEVGWMKHILHSVKKQIQITGEGKA